MPRARIITILITAAVAAVFFGSITGFFIVAKRNSGNGDGLFKTTGVVAGRVSVGPLCPVEPCERPVGDLYSSRSLIFMPKGRGRPVDLPFTIQLAYDGTFRDELPESDYEVTLTDCMFMGCEWALPKFIHVAANATATLEIDIDTGIR